MNWRLILGLVVVAVLLVFLLLNATVLVSFFNNPWFSTSLLWLLLLPFLAGLGAGFLLGRRPRPARAVSAKSVTPQP